jgi:hypothetical protein
LAPLLGRQLPAESSWRKVFLVQKYTEGKKGKPLFIAPFQAIRTRTHLYVEYINGDVELYDLRQDPRQVENLSATADPALIRRLSDRLSKLAQCAAEECRQIENAPLLLQRVRGSTLLP